MRLSSFPEVAEELARESNVTLEDMFGILGPDLFSDLPHAVRALSEGAESSFASMIAVAGDRPAGDEVVSIPAEQLWALTLFMSESAKNASRAQDMLDGTTKAVELILEEMGVLDEFTTVANRMAGKALLHMASGGGDE